MLTLVCGISNSGKTTYSGRFDDVLHLDEIGPTSRVAGMVHGLSGDVVVEGLFATSESRMELVAAYDGPTKCIWLDVPLDETLRREDRGRAECLLRSAARHFTPPTPDEGWDELEVIRP